MKECYGRLSQTFNGFLKGVIRFTLIFSPEFLLLDKPAKTVSPDEFGIDKVCRFIEKGTNESVLTLEEIFSLAVIFNLIVIVLSYFSMKSI